MSALDFMAYFDHELSPKLGVRGPSFRAALREAVFRNARSIVETGTMRQRDNWEGDGQSTVIFNAYALWYYGDFTTVDVDPEAIALAKSVVGSPKTNCYCRDSVDYLHVRKDPIDLLYLDSFDLDVKDPHPAALHCMFEFCAAWPKLHRGSIILVDDSPVAPDWEVGGKGTYVAQYLRQIGIKPFTLGYQAGWVLP